jgi:hypothetical protein
LADHDFAFVGDDSLQYFERRVGANCANGSGRLLFRNSRWTKGWKFDRSGSSTTASAKDMKIYIGQVRIGLDALCHAALPQEEYGIQEKEW